MTSQVAITLLKSLEQSLDSYCELNDEGKTAFSMAISALELFGNSEQLPSVQPEIIRCKDCKHWNNSPASDGYNSCEKDALIRHESFFCADAKLRGDSDEKCMDV